MSQMRLKKMSQMRLKRPSYMRLRRGPSMMRLKKSPEVDCVWVRGICIDSAEVELLNQVRNYDGANLHDVRMVVWGTGVEVKLLGKRSRGERDHSQ